MFKSAFSSFSVKDLKQAKDFYSNTLGLEVKEDEMGLHIGLPGGTEVFVYLKDHEAATYTVLNFLVGNIDEAVDALVAKGIVFEQYDFPDFKTDQKGIVRSPSPDKGPSIAWFKDPSGNILSVIQDK